MVEGTFLNDRDGYLPTMISIKFITPYLVKVKSWVNNDSYLKLDSFSNTDPKCHQILRDNSNLDCVIL